MHLVVLGIKVVVGTAVQHLVLTSVAYCAFTITAPAL